MSVAASLARLRANTPRPRPAPSLLHATPSVAAKTGRAEMAGLALNSLDSLAAIDPVLPSLYPPLLLTDPRRDRATLPPSEAAALSSAVVTLAARLAPAFPLRHAQKALEWLVRGLNVPNLGTHHEVDALLVAGLPFCATSQFSTLVYALLGRGVTRPQWNWLAPVVKQRKPVSVAFMLANCTNATLRLVLTAAGTAVQEGVAAVALSAFVVNVVGRRLASKATARHERRALLLDVLQAMGRVRQFKQASRRKAQTEVLCALLACLTAATAQEVEEEVVKAAVKTVVSVLMSVERRAPTSDTAVACLALLVMRVKGGVISADDGGKLVASGMLPQLLPRLGNKRVVQLTYHACVRSLIPTGNSSVESLELLRKALTPSPISLLSVDCVTHTLMKLLKGFSPPGKKSEDTYRPADDSGLVAAAVSVIIPLMRGPHVEAADVTVGKHFNSRSKKDVAAGRYDFLDKVYNAALSGSNVEEAKLGAPEVNGDSDIAFLTMLANPKPSMRNVALQKIATNKQFRDRLTEKSRTKVVAGLRSICSGGLDMEIVENGLRCLMLFPDECKPLDALEVVSKRFRDECSRLSVKKKKKKARGEALRSLGNCILDISGQCIGSDLVKVQALVLGMVLEGSLSPLTCTKIYLLSRMFAGNMGIGISIDEETVVKSGFMDSFRSALKGAASLQEGNCKLVLRTLAAWDHKWVELAADVLLTEDGGVVRNHETSMTISIVDCLTTMANDHIIAGAVLTKLVVRTFESTLRSSGPKRLVFDRLRVVWSFAVSIQDESAGLFLKKHVQAVKLDETIFFLRDVIVSSMTDNVALTAKSIPWLLNLSEFHPSIEVQREISILLLQCLYGSSPGLSKQVATFCTSRDSSSTRRRLSHLGTLMSTIGGMLKEDAVDLSTPQQTRMGPQALDEWLTDLKRRQKLLRPVFSGERLHVLDPIFRFTIRHVLQPEVSPAEKLPLLRSIGINMELSSDEVKGTIVLLTSLLKRTPSTQLSEDALSELLVRVTSLLYTVDLTEIPASSVFLAAEAVVTRFHSLWDPEQATKEISSNCLFPFIAVAVYLFSFCSSTTCLAQDAKSKLLEYLLVYSSMSSAGGTHAKLAIDELDTESLFKDLEKYVHRFVSDQDPDRPAKKSRRASQERRLSAQFSRHLFIGVIDSLRRHLLSFGNGVVLKTSNAADVIQKALWSYITLVLRKDEVGNVVFDVDGLPEFECVADILFLIQSVSKTPKVMCSEDGYRALVGGLFYRPEEEAFSSNVGILTVRRCCRKVLDVLAVGHGKRILGILAPVAENLFIKGEYGFVLEIFHTIAGTLLKCGADFSAVSRWFVRAAYPRTRDVSLSAKRHDILAFLCNLSTDMQFSLSILIEEVIYVCSRSMSDVEVAQECSLIILAMNHSATTDALTISRVNSDKRCEIATVLLIHPLFLRKLLDDVSDSDGHESSHLKVFAELFSALLSGSAKSSKQEALSILLTLLPLPGISLCISAGLQSAASSEVLDVLQALLDRLETSHIPLSRYWDIFHQKDVRGSLLQKRSEEQFVQVVGKAVHGVLVKSVTEKAENCTSRILQTDSTSLICVSLGSATELVKRLGALAPSEMLSFSTTVLNLLEESAASIVKAQTSSDVFSNRIVSASLVYMSALISCLRKYAVPFIPKVVHISLDILESFMSSSPSALQSRKSVAEEVALAESAVRTCNAVLDSNAKFFGRNSVQRVAALAVKENSQVIVDLLLKSVQMVPSTVAVLSLSSTASSFASTRISPVGVITLVRSFTTAVETMRKSELKIHIERLIGFILKCLDSRGFSAAIAHSAQTIQSIRDRDREENGDFRDLSNEMRRNDMHSDLTLQGDKFVDTACADALTTVVLRLPESSFKRVFNALLQWMDGSTIPPSILEELGMLDFTLSPKVLRSISFFRLSLQLFKKLRSIYVPYFLQVLDQVLMTVAAKKPRRQSDEIYHSQEVASALAAKRKYHTLAEDRQHTLLRQFEILQMELYNSCLDNLLEFLKLEVDTRIFTTSLAVKIRDSMTVALDEDAQMSENLEKVFNAWSRRVVALGAADESREESRELLMSLSRAVLRRTRSKEVAVRRASLQYSRSIALTVGGEYLVTLPETMPVLSEVIDDEDATVRRAAKSFVEVMESLAGEPILSQIE